MNTIQLLLALLVMTPCDKIMIDARISADRSEIKGETTCIQGRAESPSPSNYLDWLNEQEALELNDVNMPWFYPDGYRPGQTTVAPGKVTNAHKFTTRIPSRAGTLGRHPQGLYLLGGWHPSYLHEESLIPQTYEYQIEIPSKTAAMVGDTLHKPGKRRWVKGSFKGKHLPILFSDAFRIWRKGPIRLIQPLAKRSRHIDNTTAYGLKDLGRTTPLDQEEEILRTLEMLNSALPELPELKQTMTLIIGPARKKLVETFDGGALISDRAFQVLKWERLRRFHRNTLWRHFIQGKLKRFVAEREAPVDVDWVTDAIASGLRDLVYQRTYGDREWASDVLSKFAVIPEIDALIHAPQIALASTYFQAVDETTGLDTELSRFGNPFAPGKLFAEKLIDRFGQESVNQFALGYLSGQMSFHELLKQDFKSNPADIQRLLNWKSKQYPKVDYFIEKVDTNKHQTTVRIGQNGINRAQDSITVEVQTKTGPKRLTKPGPGDFEFDTSERISQIIVDPDARLVEHLHTPGQESRFNNYQESRWRFLLNNISGLFAVTNNDLSLAADFSLREIYDQTYRYRFSIHYTPSSIGGSAGVTYGFGPELTPLRLSHAIAVRGAYSYLRDEGIGLATGHLGSLRLAYSHDTRISPYFAFKGHGWNAGATAGYHTTTDGQGVYGSAGAGIYGILELPGRQGLLGRLRVDAMVGNPPEQATLRLGGLYRGARGYESDAARTETVRTIATLEHRHAFFTGARVDFWGGLMWTRLEGAFFANATYLPGHDTNCSSPVFFDVGYGLRFIGDVLNISPAALVVDVGLPLTPCAKRSEHQAVTVYLSFIQSLSGF